MYDKVPMVDDSLFYTQEIHFEQPDPVEVDEASDTESFDDYLWMQDEDEFEKSEMQRLEEEALMEECAEAMREAAAEEQEGDSRCLSQQQQTVAHLTAAALSTLNPLAIEFVPAN